MASSADRCQLTLPDLIEIMQVVMRVGVLMVQSGTVSFRVEQAMGRVAQKLGVERLDAYVTLTGITASIHAGGYHFTQIARVKQLSVNMDRLSAVEYLSLHLPADCTPTSICAILDKIEQMPAPYPWPVVVLAVAAACGAFAMLSGGNGIDFLAAFVSSGLGLLLRLWLQKKHLNPIAVTVVCAAVATSLCYAVVQGLAVWKLNSPLPQSGFLAAVLFQVPGMLLVTATLDLVRLDLVSGIARATYALLQLFSVAIGILIVMAFTGISIL